MLSIPPATTISEFPVWIACWAERNRLQARAAHFVDGHRADAVRQPAFKCSLARRILSQPGGHHIAHDAFVHAVGIDAGAFDRFPHHDRAQLRRAEIGERALKFSDRRPDRRHNHHVFHKCCTPPAVEENPMPNIIRWVYFAPRRTNPG